MANKSLQHHLFQPFSAFDLVFLKHGMPIPSVLHKMVNLMYSKKKKEKHLNNKW